MPDRVARVSNGECPLYGRVNPNPHEQQQMWRSRICNERVGTDCKDKAGTNTALSMIWGSAAERSTSYRQGSSRRTSELKRAQDNGTHNPKGTAHGYPSTGAASPRAGYAPPVQPGECTLPPEVTTPRQTNALLTKVAEQRRLGETYLRLGNLKQAQAHFREAERLLQPGAGLKEPPSELKIHMHAKQQVPGASDGNMTTSSHGQRAMNWRSFV